MSFKDWGRIRERWIVSLIVVTLRPAMGELRADEPPVANPRVAVEFVREHCLECHRGSAAEANLPLDQLTLDLKDNKNFQQWVLIHDRISKREMPPPEAKQPEAERRRAAIDSLYNSLSEFDQARQQEFGRVQLRRLNRVEYQNTLRDLLALPHLDVAEMLPPDASSDGFDNIGSALQLSYVQISRYLDAAHAAMDQAIALAPPPASTKTYLKARTNGRFSQVLRKGEEAIPIGDAVGLLRQPNTAQAPWWWSKFAPPVDGRYRIRMKLFGFVWDQGAVLPADRAHAVTLHAFQGSTKRPLGTFDVGSLEQPTILDFTPYLRQGDQIQLWFETLDDRNKGRREMNQYTAPGVAVDWCEVEGPLSEASDNTATEESNGEDAADDAVVRASESYRRLFGNLPVKIWTSDSGLIEPPTPMIISGVGKRARRVLAKRNRISLYYVDSPNPESDAQRLLTQFAERAFRRPTQATDLDDIFQLVQAKLDQKHCFQEAMRVGFQAILCSPEFLFLHERPGRLDDYALAARLSYFFWSSTPDATLLSLADQGRLRQPDVLRAQVNRMIDDPKSQRFVENFCGQWLDLRRITVTQPDEQLYPEFDQLLLNSMTEETHAYFSKMIRDDLGVAYLVDSDFAMLNGRLAELYDIPAVKGVRIREVKLPPNSPRGGIVTQASILKVTANGTTTSPVIRGAWVVDRIYGEPSPLPPPNIPAVEPDLRGATTIRKQLDLHRNDASCASCHRRIDPPGFALENFDVIGGWRDHYRSLEKGDIVDVTFKNNRPVRYRRGLPVNASGVAPSGKGFENIHEFRTILLDHQEQLARNMAQRFLIYATGAGIQFADRQIVEHIVDVSREQNFGLRSMIHAIVQSKAFRSK